MSQLPTRFESTWVLRRCTRCGRAMRVLRDSIQVRCPGCDVFAREQARSLDNQRRTRRHHERRQEHWEMLARTPLHVIYPGFMRYVERVQRWRPSHARWEATRR